MADLTTVTKTGNFVTLLFEGIGADFLYSTDASAGSRPKVASIMWKPDTDGDLIIIRDGSSSGAIVFSNVGDENLGGSIRYYQGGFGVRMNPSITVSECNTLGAGTVTFEIA